MIDLRLGDCKNILSDIVSMVDKPVIVSDPPFNIGYHYNEYSDNMSEGEYLKFVAGIFSLCPSVIVHYPESLYKISFQMGISPEKVVSWVYNSNTRKQHRDIAFF